MGTVLRTERKSWQKDSLVGIGGYHERDILVTITVVWGFLFVCFCDSVLTM